jgi:hypothetical protein
MPTRAQTERPTICSAVQPKIRAAEGLKIRTASVSSMPMIASAAASTTASSVSRASSADRWNRDPAVLRVAGGIREIEDF